MFLDVIRRRNPRLIEQAIALHQAGELPANAYVIDLDAVELNARAIAAEAAKYDLTVLAMTKQMGRNASFCRAVMRGGVAKAVAVDMGCARAVHRAGMEVGHIGARVHEYVSGPGTHDRAVSQARPETHDCGHRKALERSRCSDSLGQSDHS